MNIRTNGLTFAAINPRRADRKMFDYTVELTDEDGNIKTMSSAADVDWN